VAGLDGYRHLIASLKEKALLDPTIEKLPSDDAFKARRDHGQGLTRPELSVLMSYTKMDLTNVLMASNLPDDPALESALMAYFPVALRTKLAKEIRTHRLRRDIVATVVANEIVNRMGLTFVQRLREQTGHDEATIARAYIIVRDLYGLSDEWAAIDALDGKVAAGTQYAMHEALRQLGDFATRWFLLNGDMPLTIGKEVTRYSAPVRDIVRQLPKLLSVSQKARHESRIKEWRAKGLDLKTAEHISLAPTLKVAQDVAAIALATRKPVAAVLQAHADLAEALQVDTLHSLLDSVPTSNHWQRVALQTLVDSLYTSQKHAAIQVLTKAGKGGFEGWLKPRAQALHRYCQLVADIQAASVPDQAMLSVAVGQLKTVVGA